MRIALFGATGATGQQVVVQALERDYSVCALVRRNALTLDPRVETVTGDLEAIDSVRRVVAGCDLAISTLGFRPPLFGKKTTALYSRSASILIDGMNAENRHRLAFVTSAGVEDDPAEAWAYRHLLKPFYLRPSYVDMHAAEVLVGASKLSWTLVRPARLTDGPLTREYRISPRLRPPGGTRISRADLAHFLLDQAAGSDWVRRTPTLAY